MKKNTIISVVVFLALLVAVFLSQGGRTERGMTRISFATVEPEAIDRVVVSGTNPVELKRQDGSWVLADGRKADPRAAQRLVESIPRIESSNLVTEDDGRFADYEVGEENGTRVEAFSGVDKLAEFTVGKSASGGVHVRIDAAVYLVKRVYPHLFSRKASTWYDLKLFEIDKEQVVRVEVTPAKGPKYALVKREETWQLEDPAVVSEGFRFDTKAAASLVSSLVNLRAHEIVTDRPAPDKTGLDQPDFVLTFADREGGRHVLEIGAGAEKNNVYAKVQGNQDVVLLTKYTADNLKKQPNDLRELTLMKLDTDKVTRLAIHDGNRTLVLTKQGADWVIDKSSEPIPGDFQLDPGQVERRLKSLAGTRAMKLSPVRLEKATGLARPKSRVEATLDDDSTVTLAFGKEIEDNNRKALYALGNADDAVYLVAKSIQSSLTGGLSTLKKREGPPGGMPPNIDPAALSKLPPEVRAKLMRQMQQKQQQQQQQQMLKALQQRAQKDQKTGKQGQ